MPPVVLLSAALLLLSRGGCGLPHVDGQPAGSPDIPTLIAKSKASVVTIQTLGQSGVANSTGSGFFISPALIATCSHVLDGAFSAQVVLSDGSHEEVTAVIAEDRASDLAILRLTADPVGKPLLLAKGLPAEGEKIIVVGSPQGLEQTATDGIVSAVREQAPIRERIQISAPVSHGSSGSPVLNARGEVVAVATASILEGQNLNFAVPVSELRRLGLESRLPVEGATDHLVGVTLKDRADKILTDDFKAARRIVIETKAREHARMLDNLAFAGSDRAVEAAQIADAAAQLERVSRFAADDPEVWEYLGEARGQALIRSVGSIGGGAEEKVERLKEGAPAVARAYERAVALDRDWYPAWEGLGTWYRWAGRKEDSDHAGQEAEAAKARVWKAVLGGDGNSAKKAGKLMR